MAVIGGDFAGCRLLNEFMMYVNKYDSRGKTNEKCIPQTTNDYPFIKDTIKTFKIF